ncbi:MAG: DUF760 domain-containing protein [Desmonostoc vinosum HA7617-LM4]|jgi:hypothetical protein|nr:DUF760 domain-containing protein [Desmonostoc vinosum HA7617-LM4]
MSNLSHRNSDYLQPEAANKNNLWRYVQSMHPKTVAQLSQPSSPEVLQLIQRSIVAMLGNLPNDKYQSMITTSREELAQLLGSAMVDGYFLRNVEQRLEMEKSLQLINTTSESTEE